MRSFKKFIILIIPILVLTGACFFALKHIAEAWSGWVAIPSLIGMVVYAFVLVERDCQMFSDMAKDMWPHLVLSVLLLIPLIVWVIIS